LSLLLLLFFLSFFLILLIEREFFFFLFSSLLFLEKRMRERKKKKVNSLCVFSLIKENEKFIPSLASSSEADWVIMALIYLILCNEGWLVLLDFSRLHGSRDEPIKRRKRKSYLFYTAKMLQNTIDNLI
jgi:hypothetical protein